MNIKTAIGCLAICAPLVFLIPIFYYSQSQETILCLGDSITYGLGSSDGRGYQKYLQEFFPNRRIINEGHSGYRTDQLLNLVKKLKVDKNTTVLLMIGANDVDQSVNLIESAENVIHTFDFLLSKKAKIIIGLTIPIVGQEEKRVDRFNTILKNMVLPQYREVKFIDMNEGWRPEYFYDRSHPNDIGYRYIAKKWKEGMIQ